MGRSGGETDGEERKREKETVTEKDDSNSFISLYHYSV
jgi:hypothetical protein